MGASLEFYAAEENFTLMYFFYTLTLPLHYTPQPTISVVLIRFQDFLKEDFSLVKIEKTQISTLLFVYLVL